jgi:O-antigen ligase
MDRKKLSHYLDRTVQLALVGFAGSLPVSIAFTQSALFAGWLAWLAKCLVEKKWNGFKTPLDPGFGLFLASAILSSAFSVSPGESFLSLKKFYLLSAAYFVGFNVKSPERLLELVKLFLLMTALTGVYGMVMFAFGYQPRLLAAQGMALTSGGIFMLAGLLSLAWYRCQPKEPGGWRRGAPLGASVLLLSCLVLTRSVSSWFGLLAGIPLLIRSRWKRAVLAVLTMLLLAGVFYTANNLRLSFVLFYGNKAASWNLRLSQWKMGWQIIRERPVLGTGMVDLGKTLTERMPEKDREVWKDIPMVGHLHNNLIQITATRGITGLLAFIFMWYSIFAVAAKLMRSRSRLAAIFAGGIMAALVGFQVNGLAEWNFSDSEVVTIVWFLTGMLLALHRLECRETGQVSKEAHEAVL